MDWLSSVSAETAVFGNVSFGKVDTSLWVTHLAGEGSDECMGVLIGELQLVESRHPLGLKAAFLNHSLLGAGQLQTEGFFNGQWTLLIMNK